MKKYKVLVVGMGKRGKHHASAFYADDNFELVGICDIDAEKLKTAEVVLGNPAVGSDAAKMAKDLKPDVFCFCTMPHLRYDLIKAGIDGGAKLIAYEKPVSESMGEAIRIRELVGKSGVKTVVSHQHRYGIHYQKVKEIISGGELGRIHTVYGTSTGWMMHMMTHLIDYMRWFNGNSEALWVMAQACGKSKFKDAHRSPDYIAGFIQFANGVRGIVETGAGAPDVPEVDYWWRKCRIGAQGTDGFAEVLTGGGWRSVTKNGVSKGEGCMNYELDMPPYIRQMADWLNDDSKVHPCNGESAFKGFEIMMALCRSAAEGGQIPLPLNAGDAELDALQKKMSEKKVIPSTEANAKEYLPK